jgi:hypothetical protein
MQDLSGNGLHAIQATGTKQPILQQDSAGRFYLDFDGTDDNLQTASTFLIHDANGLSAQISAFSPVDTTTTGHLLSCSDSSKRHESRKNSAQPDLSVQNAAGAFFDAFGPSFAANDLLVMTTILGAGGIARARKNGVGGTPTTVTGTLVTGRSSALNVGCLSSAAAEFFKGKFYGGAWIAREPSVNELAAIERWFGVMVGVGI